MTISRYSYVNRFDNGKTISNSNCVEVIQNGIKTGQIKVEIVTLSGNQRLDTLAGEYYGDSSLWWIIAAASGIGWGLQVPAGTLIRIPINLETIFVIL